MALTVTSRGGNATTTGTTTAAMDGRTATLAAGSLGVLCVSLDNAGNAGSTAAAPASATDSKGNVWTLRQNGIYDNGAASAGIECAIYTAPITVALLTSDTLTLSWVAGVTVTAKAWTWYEVIPSGANTVAYSTGGVGTGATAANGQITTSSIAVGDAVIAGYFSENVAAVTGDSDSTNGSWVAQQTQTVGSTTSGVRIATQQKVQTTTASAQSYDVTVNSQDRIVAYIALHEVVNTAVVPSTLALTTTAFAPKLAATLTPSTKALSTSTFAPRAQKGTIVVPAKLSLSLTTFAPKLALSVVVPVKTLALNRFIPLLHRGVIVPTASLSLAGFAPSLGFSVTPSSIGLGIASIEPEILIRPTFFFPDPAELTLSTFAPTVVNTTPAYRFSVANTQTLGTGNPGTSLDVEIGDLLVVFAFVSTNTNDTPTCSDGSGGTYDFIGVESVVIGGIDYRLSAFVRTARVDTTATLSGITVATGSNTSRAIHVYAIAGISRAGIDAIRSSGGESNQSAGTPAPTLDQSALTGNVTLVAVGSTDTTTTPPDDWIERHDTNTTTPALSLESASRDSGFTGTAITFGAAQDTEFCSFAIELDSSGAVEIVIPDTAAITTTGFIPQLKESTIPSSASLTLSTFAASLNQSITVGNTSLTTTTHAPAVIEGQIAIPANASITTATFSPVLALKVTPSAQSMALQTFAPTLITAIRVVPSTLSLNTFGFTPGLVETLTPGTRGLSLTAFAPTVTTSNNIRVTPSTVNLSLSTFALRLAQTLTVATTTLTLATFAPSLTANITVTPTPASLTTTRFAPALADKVLVTTRALALTTLAPTAVNGQRVVPGRASLTLTRFAPTLQFGTHVIPSTRTLTLTRFAPVLSGTVTPTTRIFSISTPAPRLSFGTRVAPITTARSLTTFPPVLSESIAIPPGSLSLSTFAPALTGLVITVSPNTAQLILTAYAVNAIAFHPREGTLISSENVATQISGEDRRFEVDAEGSRRSTIAAETRKLEISRENRKD